MMEEKPFKPQSRFKVDIDKKTNYRMVATTVSQKTISWILSSASGIKPITTRHFLGELSLDLNGVFVRGMKVDLRDPNKTKYIPNDLLIFETVVVTNNDREAKKLGMKKITDMVDALSFQFNMGLEINDDWIIFDPREYGNPINIHYDVRTITISGKNKKTEIQRISEIKFNSPNIFRAISSFSPEDDTGSKESPAEIILITRDDFNDKINLVLNTDLKNKDEKNVKLALALRFYRNMLTELDIFSAFLNLWRALEILSIDENKAGAFSEDEKNEIKRIIDESERIPEDKIRLKSYIFNADAKGKLESMIENLGLNQNDILTLDKMREIRGKIIHPNKFPDEEEIVLIYNEGLRILKQAIKNKIN